MEFGDSTAVIRVVCSKGTYIRTLCADIGTRLGCGACMCSLRRIRAGRFRAEDAVSLEAVAEAREHGEHLKYLRPVDCVFGDMPEVQVSEAHSAMLKNGREISGLDLPDGKYRVYAEDGEFLMIGACAGGTLRTIKSFFEVM